ncbi:MAG: cytidylate kinase-like family protein [Prevotella sp.]|nr:cytidylate kinase-like family protein [Prevotella sp.]
MNDKKIIINVGRQLGSGGRVIAKMLADDFGCGFYDRELLNLAAKESGFREELFEQNDEHKGFFRSLFHTLSPHVSDTSFYNNNMSQESLFKFQSDAIRKAADGGSCVFVGRCADYVLRENENVFNIFITADLDYRIRQVMERRGCDEAKARKIISNGDNERASYYNYYTGKKWGASESYHLCINSSLLGLESTEKFIAQIIRERFGL